MAASTVEELLREIIGLDTDTMGRTKVELSVSRRMRALGLSNKREYFRMLRHSQREREALIEEVVVPETWFFRDKKPFTALSRYVTEICPLDRRPDSIRLLSIPCSTGEEPYSMAMTLVEAGVPRDKFSIDGVDVSRKALSLAKAAIFKERSFRDCDTRIREKYFVRMGDDYRLRNVIRSKVNFIHGNILDRRFMFSLGSYEVIFCRNLLIYFDESARIRTLKMLRNLLVDDGMFIVGHAEGGRLSNMGFVSTPFAKAFAFYKDRDSRSNTEGILDTDEYRKDHLLPPFLDQCLVHPGTNAFSSRTLKAITGRVSSKEEKGEQDILTSAKDMADRGQLDKAARLCERYLKDNGPSSRAYFLLGVISDAAGKSGRARDAFRKAIYLDPNHYESLIFLSYLAEKRGDTERADLLRQRARRAKGRIEAEQGNGTNSLCKDSRQEFV